MHQLPSLCWVARQCPRPTLRQGKTRWLPTMALKIETVTIPKGGLRGNKLPPNLGRQCIWAKMHETGGLSATLAVNRLGCCRATRPWSRFRSFGRNVTTGSPTV